MPGVLIVTFLVLTSTSFHKPLLTVKLDKPPDNFPATSDRISNLLSFKVNIVYENSSDTVCGTLEVKSAINPFFCLVRIKKENVLFSLSIVKLTEDRTNWLSKTDLLFRVLFAGDSGFLKLNECISK